MTARVLVVGWDGATFDLLDPWIESGELPNLARLIRGGARGRLRSVPNMNSGPAWTSVCTGLNPGKHGAYGLVDFAEGSYRMRPLNASDRHGKMIWERLSEAGKQVVVLNLPLTYPADPVNGAFVAGGDAPSSRSPRFTYPEELIGEINAEVGEYILAARLDGLIRRGRKADALDQLHRMIDSRTRAALHLMRRQPWDLLMVLFTASDSVQHFFWEDLAGGPHRDAILGVFRHLDSALGEILARAGDQTTVIVLSDHGFGVTQPGVRYLNSFLAELGLLRFQSRRYSATSLIRWAFLQLEMRLSARAKERLAQRFPCLHERGTAGLWMEDVDWAATQAFSLAGSNQIWINLRGRHPKGIVSPGEDYDEVVALIQGTLGEAVDPATGMSAVKAVRRRTDLYGGPYLNQAPDLLVEWVDEAVRSGLAWHGEGQQVVATRSFTHRRHPVNGSHRKMGVLVAHGTPFRRGVTIDGATLYDIAPTLLHLLGEPIPAVLDGKSLTGALDDAWLQVHPAQFSGGEQEGPGCARVSMSLEDEDEVMQRLRGLGYVE